MVASSADNSRASTSVALPGACGTIRRIGFSGNCACAEAGPPTTPAAPTARSSALTVHTNRRHLTISVLLQMGKLRRQLLRDAKGENTSIIQDAPNCTRARRVVTLVL